MASYLRMRLLELREAGLRRAIEVVERRLPVDALLTAPQPPNAHLAAARLGGVGHDQANLERVREPSFEDPGQERPPRGGFALPLDIVVAPARAFRTIEATREWLPAYVLIVVLASLELYLLAPGLQHVAAEQVKSAGQGARTSQAAIVAIVDQVATGTIGPLVTAAFIASLLSAASLGAVGGLGRFATFFSLSVNCAVPYGIGGVISALAVRVHDPRGFRTPSDLMLASASLASLRPHGPAREIAFLGYWDPFTLWSLLLLGYGFAALGNVRLFPALLFALAIGLSFALLLASQFP